MNRSVAVSFGSLIALGFAVSACSSADNSSGDPNAQGTGGFMGVGGFNPGAGGQIPGGGGSFPGGGGANPGGGTNPGSGGANPNGGAPPGSGGAPPGSGGALPGGGGTQGAGGENVGAGGAPPASAGVCITDPANQAVIVGDSYVTGFGSPPLQPALATIIPSITNYPNYAGAGCSMASGGVCTGLYGNVPQQATTALQQHPQTKFVIMDGGGNDILICNASYTGCATLCKAAGSSTTKVCTDIVDLAITTAGKLMTDSATAGVRDVIYFFYPHLPGPNAGYAEILDYAEPKAKALCDNAASTTGGKLRCHFVDLVQPFKNAGGDGNPANFVADSIHPSAAGQAIIAKAVTDRMTADCLGQPSGCCSAQ